MYCPEQILTVMLNFLVAVNQMFTVGDVILLSFSCISDMISLKYQNTVQK